jgi:hypothetical protein
MLDREVLLGGAYLADDRPAIEPFGKAGLSARLNRGASLIAVVLLSLGLWAVIWEIASCASGALAISR